MTRSNLPAAPRRVEEFWTGGSGEGSEVPTGARRRNRSTDRCRRVLFQLIRDHFTQEKATGEVGRLLGNRGLHGGETRGGFGQVGILLFADVHKETFVGGRNQIGNLPLIQAVQRCQRR